jgi:hypothetical protein
MSTEVLCGVADPEVTGLPGCGMWRPDILREIIREVAQNTVDAEAEVRCNAAYGGQPGPDQQP